MKKRSVREIKLLRESDERTKRIGRRKIKRRSERVGRERRERSGMILKAKKIGKSVRFKNIEVKKMKALLIEKIGLNKRRRKGIRRRSQLTKKT